MYHRFPGTCGWSVDLVGTVPQYQRSTSDCRTYRRIHLLSDCLPSGSASKRRFAKGRTTHWDQVDPGNIIPSTCPLIFLVVHPLTAHQIQNEFVAYTNLQTDPAYADLSPRSRLIATYALCGFANIGSLGTQIGVLSQISPGRSGDVSRLAVSALIAGALSTLTSASIAGLLVTDQAAYTSPSTAS